MSAGGGRGLGCVGPGGEALWVLKIRKGPWLATGHHVHYCSLGSLLERAVRQSFGQDGHGALLGVHC